MKTLNKIITKVDCSRGAPMGRPSCTEDQKPDDKTIFDSKVNLSQGYDAGGAYWGTPNNLRVEYTKDLSYVRFYRS